MRASREILRAAREAEAQSDQERTPRPRRPFEERRHRKEERGDQRERRAPERRREEVRSLERREEPRREDLRREEPRREEARAERSIREEQPAMEGAPQGAPGQAEGALLNREEGAPRSLPSTRPAGPGSGRAQRADDSPMIHEIGRAHV